jgi:hypothetical protein
MEQSVNFNTWKGARDFAGEFSKITGDLGIQILDLKEWGRQWLCLLFCITSLITEKSELYSMLQPS